MTRPITALIVEDDHNIRELWSQVISPITRVKCASTVPEALALMDDADILLLDWHLCGVSADVVLDQWIADIGGPVCVLSGVLDLEQLYELFSRGVYNAFLKPVPVTTITAVVRHYCKDVQMRREMDMLANEVHSLRRWTIAFAVMAAAALGPTLGMRIVDLLTGLF